MNCPYCKSKAVVEGSDFYLCNNPHCLRIWFKDSHKTSPSYVIGEIPIKRGLKLKAQKAGEKSNDKSKRRSRKL